MSLSFCCSSLKWSHMTLPLSSLFCCKLTAIVLEGWPASHNTSSMITMHGALCALFVYEFPVSHPPSENVTMIVLYKLCSCGRRLGAISPQPAPWSVLGHWSLWKCGRFNCMLSPQHEWGPGICRHLRLHCHEHRRALHGF